MPYVGCIPDELADSNTHEHMSSDDIYSIHGYVHYTNLLCLKFQSRHVSHSQYRSNIRFREGAVDSWFCSFPVGACVVGTCAHVSIALWQLCFMRHQADNISDGVNNWAAVISYAAYVSYYLTIFGDLHTQPTLAALVALIKK